MKSGHPDQLGSCEEALISKGVAEKTKRWRLYILQQFLSNLNGRLHIKSYLGGGGGGGRGRVKFVPVIATLPILGLKFMKLFCAFL